MQKKTNNNNNKNNNNNNNNNNSRVVKLARFFVFWHAKADDWLRCQQTLFHIRRNAIYSFLLCAVGKKHIESLHALFVFSTFES